MSAILVADDDRRCRDSIQRVLEREGHLVTAVEDAEGALDVAARQNFDLVICDYRMPGKSGLDLLTELKKRQPVIPVLMISAFADTETVARAMELGALEVLRKPFRRQELIDSATRAVGKLCA